MCHANVTSRLCGTPRKNSESGFTLIELLVVVAIVSVLAAIALPQFESYREGAYDTEAKTALRSVAIAEEAYFTLNNAYISCDQSSCHSLLPDLEPLEDGIVLEMVASSEDFSGSAWHEQGTLRIFEWN